MFSSIDFFLFWKMPKQLSVSFDLTVWFDQRFSIGNVNHRVYNTQHTLLKVDDQKTIDWRNWKIRIYLFCCFVCYLVHPAMSVEWINELSSILLCFASLDIILSICFRDTNLCIFAPMTQSKQQVLHRHLLNWTTIQQLMNL